MINEYELERWMKYFSSIDHIYRAALQTPEYVQDRKDVIELLYEISKNDEHFKKKVVIDFKKWEKVKNVNS